MADETRPPGRCLWKVRSRASSPALALSVRGFALLLPGLLAACSSSTPNYVDRVQDGRTWRGRYIQDQAYAWYARGVYLETHGRGQEAEQAFLEALARDPESGSLWARVGSLRCRRGDVTASDAFESGFRTGADLATIFTERGRCALLQNQHEAALADGQAAVQHDARAVNASLLVVDALLALGREQEAMSWLDALAAFAPGSPGVQSRRIAEARRLSDASRERRGREAHRLILHARGVGSIADDLDVEIQGKSAVDAAVVSGRIELARNRATALGMHPSELALRAIALGRPELAFSMAQLVLEASPEDPNARVALLLAQDLLPAAPPPPIVLDGRGASSEVDPLHPLAILLFAEMLDRRVGTEAGNLWRNAHQVPPAADQLVERVRARQDGSPRVDL